ncbi:MAG TPA: TonB-dependent receptor [Brevundimonas sp.]|uniref:TonB-dependent receptor n=1 Tax=Brevundimonas sp. TaxID=1871086 RepID=UPI002EDB2EEB
MSNRSGLRLALLAGASLGAFASPALAQSPAPISYIAAPETTDPEGDPLARVDDVFVTATKRETNLQDTAIAISVVGAQTLEDRHVQSLLDLFDGAVPSLRVSTFESRQTALTVGIRGIVPNDANQPAREQGVGVYLDGVYLGRQQGLNATMLDIERVEVLRGPQGTLFGRNTEGGAVSLVTRRPTGEFGLRTRAGLSNYGGYNAEAHLDLPEFAGVSVKLDGAFQHRDETTRNPMEGQTGWNYIDRRGLRVSALWRPTEAFNALYAYDNGYSESTPFLSQLVNYNPLGLPVSTAFPRPVGTISPLPPGVFVHPERQDVADIGVPQQPSVDKTFGHSLHMNLDVTPDLELRSITAYREVEAYQYDNAGGPNRPPVFQPNAPAGNAARNFSRYSLSDMQQSQFSQEFQLVGSAFEDRFEYVVGLYYFEEEAWEEAATPSTLTYVGSNGDYVVRDPKTAGITRGFRSIDRGSRAEAMSTGLYVHTVWTPPVLNDALHLTLGGRQTRDEKNGVLYRVSNTPRDFRFELTESRFDPVVTLAYDATPDINLYATYATGYRAGGANSRSLTYAPFDSEEVASYEIGMKSTLFDRLQLNVAAYAMERTNSQIEFTLVAPDPVTGNTRNTVETVNAPGVTDISGLELDAVLELTEELRFTFGYAYTETSVPDAQNPFPASPACPACGAIQPVFIIYTPPHAATASLDWVRPFSWGEFRAHIDANYSEGTQSFEQSPEKTDDSFIVNARLALAEVVVGDGRELTFSVWSRNLLNEEHIYRRSTEGRSGTNAIGDYANFNEPRTYGLEISARF